MTAEELDEMRARKMAEHCYPPEAEGFEHFYLLTRDTTWRKQARAIREADEAAGLKIVPGEATKEMVRAFTGDQGCEPTWGLASMGTANTVEGLNAAIAAGAIREDEG